MAIAGAERFSHRLRNDCSLVLTARLFVLPIRIFPNAVELRAWTERPVQSDVSYRIATPGVALINANRVINLSADFTQLSTKLTARIYSGAENRSVLHDFPVPVERANPPLVVVGTPNHHRGFPTLSPSEVEEGRRSWETPPSKTHWSVRRDWRLLQESGSRD